jgi:hypothetical protein
LIEVVLFEIYVVCWDNKVLLFSLSVCNDETLVFNKLIDEVFWFILFVLLVVLTFSFDTSVFKLSI